MPSGTQPTTTLSRFWIWFWPLLIPVVIVSFLIFSKRVGSPQPQNLMKPMQGVRVPAGTLEKERKLPVIEP